jgi:hypothetical protein
MNFSNLTEYRVFSLILPCGKNNPTVFAEYSVRDLLIFVGVVVVLSILIGILKRVFKKKEINK